MTTAKAISEPYSHTAVDITDGSGRIALEGARRIVEPALRAAVDELSDAMRLISGYHLGWWDEAGRPTVSGGGKVLRPALVLLTASAIGGRRAEEDAVPAAVAVELVHNFSLLHDDVMDGDRTRRHRRTAWTVFGTDAAILAGDALQNHAVEVLASSGHPAALNGVRELTRGVIRLIDGQSMDMAFEKRTDVELNECEAMAGAKTGALMACSTALGAVFAGLAAEQVAHWRRFGETLGLAFQLRDDLLGIWGDPKVTGKPAHSDLANRKKTLPIVAALTAGTSASRELAALYHREEPLSESERRKAADLVERAGGRAWSHRRATDLLRSALADLRGAAPPSESRDQLAGLARLIAGSV